MFCKNVGSIKGISSLEILLISKEPWQNDHERQDEKRNDKSANSSLFVSSSTSGRHTTKGVLIPWEGDHPWSRAEPKNKKYQKISCKEVEISKSSTNMQNDISIDPNSARKSMESNITHNNLLILLVPPSRYMLSFLCLV